MTPAQPRNNSTTKRPLPDLPIQKELMAALELMQEFQGLLEQETEALRTANFEKVEALQTKKQNLAQRYHDRVLNLNKRREEISTTDENLKTRMVMARKEFTETLTENLTALEGVKKSSQRLIEKIVDAARDAVKNHPSYAGKGFGRRTPLSISLNEEL